MTLTLIIAATAIALIPWSLRKLWLRYVLVMAFQHADDTSPLHHEVKALALGPAAVGVALDVFCQMYSTTILFLELPLVRGDRWWKWRVEWLVTDRLQRHMRAGTGWRYRMAAYVCERWVSPFDAGHCE